MIYVPDFFLSFLILISFQIIRYKTLSFDVSFGDTIAVVQSRDN